MLEQVALADFLVEYSTCTEIRAVESSAGSFVQSKTGKLGMTCTSDALLPLAEHLTT